MVLPPVCESDHLCLSTLQERMPRPNFAHFKGTWTVRGSSASGNIKPLATSKPGKKLILLMPLPTAAVSSYNFAGAAFGDVAVFQKMVPTELLSLQLTRLNCLLRAADTASAFYYVNVEREPWDLILSRSLLHNPCSNLS